MASIEERRLVSSLAAPFESEIAAAGPPSSELTAVANRSMSVSGLSTARRRRRYKKRTRSTSTAAMLATIVRKIPRRSSWRKRGVA